MKPQSIQTSQHLYQLHPNLPKYANDPEESAIIETYDLLLKRFQGIYGREPKYFVRSPVTCPIFGSTSKSVSLSLASICCAQNVIVSLALNGHSQIRINHYQNAVHGEKVFQSQSGKWKYDQMNDEYSNILVASLKTFSLMFNIHTLPGVDVLIYDNFIHDDHLNSKEALSLGIVVALHTILEQKGSLNAEFCRTFLNRLSHLLNSVKAIDFPARGHYGFISISSTHKQLNQRLVLFPQDLQIILAHSMTPLPKKMTSGKRQNLRACQIAIGIQIIKNQIGAVNSISSLGSYQFMSGELKNHLNSSTKQILELVQEYVPKEELSVEKIEQLTSKSLIQILKPIPFANNVIDQNLAFKPYNRIKHCLLQDLAIEHLSTQNFLSTLRSSSESARELLEIGSEQFDEMIQVVKHLAKAWKIIGDGWGGYLMIVCSSSQTKQIVDLLTSQFYLSAKNKVLLSDDIDQYVGVVGRPSTGLCILDPSSEIWYC